MSDVKPTMLEVAKFSAIKNAESNARNMLANMAELLDCPLSDSDKEAVKELRALFYHLTDAGYQLDKKIGIKH